MKKTIISALIDAVFMMIIGALFLVLVSGWLDKKISRECECGSNLPWCPEYWDDKHICGR